MRTLEEFNGIYDGQSKTAFILGAGTSLHFHDLDLLKDRLVFAVNSAYVAVPGATYFLSDDQSVRFWSFFFKDLRKSKTTIALLYEDKLSVSAPWFGDRAVLFRHCKGINIPDKYIHDDPKYHIGETRNSLGSAIMVARIMGCAEIILLGVDGCRKFGKRYFWQLDQLFSNQKKYEAPFRNDGVPIDCYKRCKIDGQETDYDLVDINRSWASFGEAVNKKCKVYNASESSILTIFPKKKLETIIEELDGP